MLFTAGILFLFPLGIRSQNSFDSLNIKMPKHYFNTLFDLDIYRKPNVSFRDTVSPLSKRLKSYGIKQFYLSFYTPLRTKDWMTADSTIKNTHLLLTGNFMSLRPTFDGISQHNLVKFGIGIRFIYNTGKKGVWFADVSPFVTRDVTYPSRPYYRMASTLVYSHNVSMAFNWRLGITKSFMWGNRFYLPFVGLRIGRLDKINLSIQFPRSASFNMPVSRKVILSVYTRPQGGMWNFSNADTLYFRKTDATFHFTRYEINTGFRGDFRMSSHFSFYVALGLSTKNNITFYSERANTGQKVGAYSTHFFTKNIPPSAYLNFGFVLRFGKTRSYYNNKNIYDAIDINNQANGNNGNLPIPLDSKKKPKDINLESVRDLVDYNDF
jgi:hypothetical protein